MPSTEETRCALPTTGQSLSYKPACSSAPSLAPSICQSLARLLTLTRSLKYLPIYPLTHSLTLFMASFMRLLQAGQLHSELLKVHITTRDNNTVARTH